MHIFWQSLKDRKTYLIAFCIGAALFLWMYIALFPSIRDQSANLMKLMESYPESFLKAFNIESLDYSNVENYLSSENFSFIWPLLIIFLGIAIGAAICAGEIEKGTIELLLAQPISRIRIFFEKYFAGFFSILIFDIVSIFAIIPFAAMYNVDYKLENFTTMAILGLLFALTIFSISALFSCIFSDKGKVYFLSGGLLVVMYVMNILASLKENIQDLKYFSFFYYFDASKALNHNQIDILAWLVFGGTIILCILVAVIIFNKRNITV